MLLRKLKNISFFSRISLLAILFLANACAEVKKAAVHDYPKQKAFVFDNKIVIHDAESKKVKNTLSYALDNYWDDSLKAKRIRQYAIFNKLINPIIYQPARNERTVHYVQNYLASIGYHHPSIQVIEKVDTVHDEFRVYLTLQVFLHKKTKIDTVTYDLIDKNIQNIAIANADKAYIKKGMDFSNIAIDNELDRLVALFRKNGYYFFTKEKIFAEIDTLDPTLMKLNLDPLAQITQVQDAGKKRNENPHWKVSFQLRNLDSNITKTYPIGNQSFYSDLSLADNADSVLFNGRKFTENYGEISQSFNKPLFKSSLFSEQSIIHKGDVFNESLFYKTLYNYSTLGAWQQIDARTFLVNDSVQLKFLLVPNLRRNLNLDLEGSKNSSQVGSGNLIGLSTSLTFRNRNVLKKSIQSISSLRTGVEFDLNNNNLTQTLLFNIGQTYNFPELLIPFKPVHKSTNSTDKSVFSLNGSYTDRLNYYQLKSFTTNWGYEWKKLKKNAENVVTYKPLNIELYNLQKFAKLDSLLLLNPFLRSSFNNGNVISQTLQFIHTGPATSNPNQINYFRIGIEEAGALVGLSPSMQKNSYRYLKAELEIRKLFKYDYTELAWRFMGGWGNNYNSDGAIGGQLPFFKQFTAGGPYSMRAWGLRQLGLGSSQFYDTSKKSQNFDRFGDMQLETNLEYRFTIFQSSSYKIGSALFTDMGNIWNTRDTKQDPKAGFELNKLYKDLAIGIGTGIRLDFNYFLIRIDYALKLKDPARDVNNGWLNLNNLKWTEVKPNGTRVNNYAWQFGIGLPF